MVYLSHSQGLFPSPSREATRSRAVRPLVLVVDDSRSNRRMLQRLVQKLGYDVLLGEDGLGALEKMKKKAAPDAGPRSGAESPCLGRTVGEGVSLVLLDISMPQMDGPTFAAALKRDHRYAGISIVGVTGNALEEDRALFLEAGAAEIAMKAVGRDRVQGILDKWVRGTAS